MKSFQNVECIRCNVIECLTQVHKRKKRKWSRKLDAYPCFSCGFPVWESWLIWKRYYKGKPINIQAEIDRVMNEQVKNWMEDDTLEPLQANI